LWINTNNLMASPCAPGEQDSTWDSASFFHMLAQSASSNGKLLPSSTWRRLWKKDFWLKRLFGRTSSPSTAQRGVELWITSLRATRASHSHSPVSVVDRAIHGIFGRTCVESLTRLNQALYFSKTCPVTSASDSTRSPKSLKQWNTQLRQVCSRRERQAIRRNGKGSSSSLWPTARASLQENRTTKHAPSHGKTHGKTLAGEACTVTPNLLPHGGNRKGFGRLWPAPAARDSKGANSLEHVTVNGTGRKHLDQLANFASHCFHPALAKSNSGKPSSEATNQLPRLNPRFVCWLMGWPWINPASSALTETESSQSRQRMRLSLFGPLSDPIRWRNAWLQVLASLVTSSTFIAPAAKEKKKTKAA
jgi:hypothetical protein